MKIYLSKVVRKRQITCLGELVFFCKLINAFKGESGKLSVI